MVGEERRTHILEELKRNNKVLVDELSEKFMVSKMTIRRDLEILKDMGLLQRIHGGALPSDIMKDEVPYISKEISHHQEKERLGKRAAEFIKDKQVIILDAGTTCLEIAKNLLDKKGITVITNDIRIMNMLYQCTNISVFCVGGYIQPQVGAVIGEFAQRFIEEMNVDIAFIGASSIDDSLFMSTPTYEKAFLKKAMMRCANEIVVAADQSKFNKRSLNKICSLQEIDLLVTNYEIGDELAKRLKNCVPELILC